jgi:hypothetical protein
MDTLSASHCNDPTAPETTAELRAATVTGQAAKWLFLDSDATPALRAESCLLQPEAGDLVLVCSGLPAMPAADGVAAVVSAPYVLAVLSRPRVGPATLNLPGGAAISTAHGSLRFSAGDIVLDATDGVRTCTKHFEVDSISASIDFHHARTRIGTLDAGIGRLTLAAKALITTVGRLVQRASESFRWIESTDELRAGNARWRITGHVRMDTRHTTFQSEELTRIDGSKIELG